MSKLILLDVFSYSCMNCLRSLSFIKSIGNKHKKFGLETILVHPPEWKFEKLKQNLVFAAKKYRIYLPIIMDKDKKIIKKLKINFWPAQILLKDGKIVYKHIGEGDYRNLENKIIRILKSKNKRVFDKEPVYTKFPAIYCGSMKKGRIVSLMTNGKLRFGTMYKDGRWAQKNEFIKPIGKNNSLTILTKGKEVDFVAESRNKKQIKVSVNLDGKNIKYLTISKPQLYRIMNLKGNKARKLTITANSNLAIYSFSFR